MKIQHKRVLALLCALCVVLAGSFAFAYSRILAYRKATDAAYRRAMYETAELIGGVRGNLLKLPACQESAQKQWTLAQIDRQAFGAQENLTCLPSDASSLESTLKFVNQVQDYSQALSLSLSKGGELMEKDEAQLLSLAESCLALQAELLGSAEALSPIHFEAQDITGIQTDESSVQYPKLIYDGPFSDDWETGPIPKEGGIEVEQPSAEAVAWEYMQELGVTELRLTGMIEQPALCYEFEGLPGPVYAAVTKTGGKILYLLSAYAPAQSTIGEEQALKNAAAFLRSHGFDGMEPTYHSTESGYMTVNFAATQDGILLYPDLVKVEVNMENGQVEGMESRRYLANHCVRAWPQNLIDAQEALSCVSPRLQAEEQRLCVIPLFDSERLCWEIRGEIEKMGTYLVYIDACTGEETQILRLVETETGWKTY